MRAKGLTTQQPIKINLVALIIEIEMDAVTIERFELVNLGAEFAVAHRVMQLKFSAQRG